MCSRKLLFLVTIMFIFSQSSLSQDQSQYKFNVTVYIGKDPDPAPPLVRDSVAVKRRSDVLASNMEIEKHVSGSRLLSTGFDPGISKLYEASIIPHYEIPLPEMEIAPLTFGTYRVWYDTTYFPLKFGEVYISDKPGAIFLSPDPSVDRLAIGYNKLGDKKGCGPAKLLMSGYKNMSYDIAFPDSVILYHTSDSSQTTVAKYFTPSTQIFRLDDNGKQTIFIGGQLTTNEKCAVGLYRGILTITVYYFKEPKVYFID